MRFEFESPLFLTLLVALPLLFAVLRFSLTDSPLGQRLLSALVRGVVVFLVVLALADALWIRKVDDPAVLVVADLSDSVPKDAPTQLKTFLDQLETRVSNPSMAGLVTVASKPELVQPVVMHPKFPETITVPEAGEETRLADALSLAREVMPHEKVNRVVVFSDGNETDGDALSAARRLAAQGVKIFTVPYTREEKPEVLLEDLQVPAEVKRGQSFGITATAHATQDTKGQFTLYRDGFKVGEKEIELKKGANALSFDESNPPDGLVKYELRVTTPDDFFVDNNVSSGMVFVSGEPRVLLLEGEEREGRHLARALEAENIRVDFRESKGMPGTLEEIAAFDAIIFSDVPATDVTVQQMALLRSYIEDLGGGFIMLGGENSFGLGGYYRTSIEAALPVRMRSEKKKDTPSLAMMLIVDKSGSMGGEKIQLAKEAAIAAVELLGSRDYVGVIGFDNEPQWVVDLQSAGNQGGVIQTIESIEAGGGTNIAPAMDEAATALAGVSATFKHAILLTDGQSQEGDYAGIVDRMVGDQVTVSTVAVGEGADTALLQDIARWGRGRYYFTADPYDIPQIFTKETMSASKSSLVEEPFLPQVLHNDPVIQGIDWGSTPFLFGYVVCSAKATAKVPLITERGDPLLATWRFGLGKTAAFMSDAKSRWAGDWLGWPGYNVFWAQVVRDTMRVTQNQGNETQIAFKGSAGHIIIDSVDDDGNFVNGLNTSVQLVRPSLEMESVPLTQTAPGRYEAQVATSETGSYLFKIHQEKGVGDKAEAHSDFTRGLTISYKPEYRHLATNTEFLTEMATATGGKLSPTLDEIMAVSPEEAVRVRTQIWPWLLIAALLLFVADVAVRRFDLAGVRLLGGDQRYG